MRKRYKIIVTLAVSLGVIGFWRISGNIKNLPFFSGKSVKIESSQPAQLAESDQCSLFNQEIGEASSQNQGSGEVLISGCGGFF